MCILFQRHIFDVLGFTLYIVADENIGLSQSELLECSDPTSDVITYTNSQRKTGGSTQEMTSVDDRKWHGCQSYWTTPISTVPVPRCQFHADSSTTRLFSVGLSEQITADQQSKLVVPVCFGASLLCFLVLDRVPGTTELHLCIKHLNFTSF